MFHYQRSEEIVSVFSDIALGWTNKQKWIIIFLFKTSLYLQTECRIYWQIEGLDGMSSILILSNISCTSSLLVEYAAERRLRIIRPPVTPVNDRKMGAIPKRSIVCEIGRIPNNKLVIVKATSCHYMSQNRRGGEAIDWVNWPSIVK